MPNDGLKRQPIEDTSIHDATFIGAVLMLHDGYSAHTGEEANHRLACLHANIIAACAVRFTGADRAHLLFDVQRIISSQLREADGKHGSVSERPDSPELAHKK